MPPYDDPLGDEEQGGRSAAQLQLPRYLPPLNEQQQQRTNSRAAPTTEQQPLLHVSRSSSTLTSSDDPSSPAPAPTTTTIIDHYGATHLPPLNSIWLLKQEEGASGMADADDTFTLTKTKLKKPWCKTRVDTEAFQFALRMAILLAISSLFVLCGDPDDKYPSGMWVLVSVLFVSWFPSLGT